MKILVTGATGLVGTALTDFLLQSGHIVHVLTTTKNKTFSHKRVFVFQWKPNQSLIDMKAFEGVEAIVHLAGASISQRWTAKARQDIIDSRVLSTRLLSEAIQNSSSVKHVVCASAIGVYPSHPSKVYVEDESSTARSFTGEVVQKWEAEATALRKLSVSVSILRIGLVMSNNGGALVPLKAPTKWGMGAWFGNGQQWQSWIHISDLVRIIDFVIKNKKDGVFNATAPLPVNQRNLVKSIAKTLGVPQWMPGIPQFPIRLIMGAMSSVLFESLRVSSKRLSDQGFEFSFQDIDSCLKDLLR
jgi:uncharacterized protein (TIGR01777 family)